MDSENCIWLRHFVGSRITCYSPEGQVLQVMAMPVPNITRCTFAGPDLDTLYITTARHLLSGEKYTNTRCQAARLLANPA